MDARKNSCNASFAFMTLATKISSNSPPVIEGGGLKHTYKHTHTNTHTHTHTHTHTQTLTLGVCDHENMPGHLITSRLHTLQVKGTAQQLAVQTLHSPDAFWRWYILCCLSPLPHPPSRQNYCMVVNNGSAVDFSNTYDSRNG